MFAKALAHSRGSRLRNLFTPKSQRLAHVVANKYNELLVATPHIRNLVCVGERQFYDTTWELDLVTGTGDVHHMCITRRDGETPLRMLDALRDTVTPAAVAALDERGSIWYD